MNNNSVKCLLLCSILACLNSCNDVSISLESKDGDSVCVDNKLYLFEDEEFKTKYCSECIEGKYCKQCEKSNCINKQDDNGVVGTLFICDNKKQKSSMECENSCNEDRSNCGTCINGKMTCKDGKYSICVDGKFDEGTKCKSETCMGEQCAECNNEMKRCANAYMLQKCQDLKWHDDYDCKSGGQLCVNGECQDTCEENSKYCINNDKEIGQLEICNNNSWSDLIECQDGNSCKSDNTDCGECRNGTNKMENGDGYTCVNGAWMQTTHSVCESGEKKCEYDTAYECQAGDWVTEKCDFGCDGNKCKEGESGVDDVVCNTGETRCDNGQISSCQNGQWGEFEACPTNACDGNKCKEAESGDGVTCDEGTVKCDGNNLIKCEDGVVKNEQCDYGCDSENTKCKERDETGCTDNEMQCSSDGKTPQICNEGKWIDDVQKKCTYECAVNQNKVAYCTFSDCEYALVCTDGEVKVCNKEYTECTKIDNDISCNDINKASLSQMYAKGKILTIGSEHWKVTGFSGLYQNDTLSNGDYACLEKIDEYSNSCDYTIKNDDSLKICKGDECFKYSPSAAYQDANLCPNKKCINYNNTGIKVTSCNLIDGIACIVATECESGNSCSESYNKCGECKNGETRCNSTGNLDSCNSGTWTFNAKPCLNGCEDRACRTIEGCDGILTNNQQKLVLCLKWPVDNIESDCLILGNYINGGYCSNLKIIYQNRPDFNINGARVTDCDDNNGQQAFACLIMKTSDKNDCETCKFIRTECINEENIGTVYNICETEQKCINKHCQNNGAPVSCNKDKTDCGECKNGYFKCNEIQAECKEGAWIETNDAKMFCNQIPLSFCSSTTCINDSDNIGIQHCYIEGGQTFVKKCANDNQKASCHDNKCGVCLNNTFCYSSSKILEGSNPEITVSACIDGTLVPQPNVRYYDVNKEKYACGITINGNRCPDCNAITPIPSDDCLIPVCLSYFDDVIDQ